MNWQEGAFGHRAIGPSNAVAKRTSLPLLADHILCYAAQSLRSLHTGGDGMANKKKGGKKGGKKGK